MTTSRTFVAALTLVVAVVLSPYSLAGSVASGTKWDNVGQKTSGSWAIVEEGDRYFVEFGADFRARRAPDLKVYLSRNAARGLGNANGLDSTVFVAKLKSVSGKQRYALPNGVRPADFSSLVIYCEAFSKFWAAADL